jgi:hypothetical protein
MFMLRCCFLFGFWVHDDEWKSEAVTGEIHEE